MEIIVDIITSLPGILIAAATAYYFSQRKYTFEKLHDRKLLYIEEIFGQVVSLEKDLKKYVMTTGSMIGEGYLEDRIKELKPIQEKFFVLQEYFWKKEILLNQSSVKSIQVFVDTSIQVLVKLQSSNRSTASRDYEISNKQWGEAYEAMQSKLINAKMNLKKEFRKVVAK